MQFVQHDAFEAAELLPGEGAAAQGQELLHAQWAHLPLFEAMSRAVTGVAGSSLQPREGLGATRLLGAGMTGTALLRGRVGVGRTANKFL